CQMLDAVRRQDEVVARVAHRIESAGLTKKLVARGFTWIEHERPTRPLRANPCRVACKVVVVDALCPIVHRERSTTSEDAARPPEFEPDLPRKVVLRARRRRPLGRQP